ncbi:MAG: sigma-70 family RNA polymerase sigma factor, partial [Clostridia bacterium]|nr:sigma-70 family RNA polymerase sigma factor [Clostridia bacterium]
PDSSVKNHRAWVFQMTRNLSLDALKKKQHEDIEKAEIATDEYDFISARIDIENALSRLPQREREIISLHLIGGLGFWDISRIVGISMPAAYRAYRKALYAVREYLGGNL